MAFEAGSVVMLKSGGQPMTVVSSSEDEAECIWIGEEGEFFRQSIPSVALAALEIDEDEEDEDEDESEDDEDEDEEEEKAPKGKRSAA